MENAIEIQVRLGIRNEGQLVSRKKKVRTKTPKRLSVLEWYRILRAHYHHSIFQAIRFALWLAR